jgi:DNA repair ATPase RecN
VLLEINIRNIALIESLGIEFSRGFNVLTGETGAGKSIVVDSLNLALGCRAERDMIRTGAEKASVQALLTSPTARAPSKRSRRSARPRRMGLWPFRASSRLPGETSAGYRAPSCRFRP